MSSSNLNLPTVTLQPTPTPTAGSDPGTKIVLLAPKPSSWTTWTSSQKSGVIAASIIAALLLISVITWLYLLNQKRARKMQELERGPNPLDENKRRRAASVSSVVKGKMRARSRSRSKSRPRGIEGLENIEIGTAAETAIEMSRAANFGTSRGA